MPIERRGARLKKYLAGRDGFTLIEVMVATLLLALVLLPMLGVFIMSVGAATKTETENTASLLAQEQIEEVRGLAYDAMALDSAQIDPDSGITGTPPMFTYEGADYEVVAVNGGAVKPVSTDTKRRNSFYDVRRYVLWVDNPAGGATLQDYKKIVVVVSWSVPQPGSMAFEADAQRVGLDSSQPPVVVGTYPYIGDAFRYWNEIGEAAATANDPDGTPVKVQFQYKKNVDASFSNVGTDLSGTPVPDGYDFSVSWNSILSAEAQYNLRAIATDDNGLTGTDTHPFFIDATPPPPPSALWVTDLSGIPCDPAGAPWPLVLNWEPVRDYINQNTNFNMVIGYLIYRDERLVQEGPDAEVPVVTSTLVASIHRSDVASFHDATTVSPGTEVRYRVKSLARAANWRRTGLAELSEVATGWFKVITPPASPYMLPTLEVLAEPGSWSAVDLTLTWPSSTSPANTLYLIYRTPGWAGEDESLVGTVSDPTGGRSVIVYKDENLRRNSTYSYRVVPVATFAYPPDLGSQAGLSNEVRTSLY